MTRRKEPSWISLNEILALHEQLLAFFGGRNGIRDRGLLESALVRAKNLWSYEKADPFRMAAAYADGIVRNHPFIDGNKRTGFVAAVLFLESNGYQFRAPEEQAVQMTVSLASGQISLDHFALWLKDWSAK